ncbi:MAG: hemerythrin family protein [Gammaproteobacteria bacterium]|nr:bacteriohemerythrin [Gammaproteobacteria bacterium]NNJ98463.1 hemerythrin family protein [Gammaproteobacteria bacterium]
MAFFEWDEKYSVSVPSIDRQHRDLIDYINKLQTELASPEPDSMIIEVILNGLIGYTNTHFKYEEMLFSMYKYPETEEHKAAHNRLFETVARFKQRYEEGVPNVGDELLAFLKIWLNHHILKEDMAYSAHMVAKKVN